MPPVLAYPTELATVGNHLRTRRFDLGLLQKEVAVELGVGASSVYNRESGRTEPEFRHLPAIIAFLGYDPTPKGKTLGQRVRRTRRALGLSQKQLATELGMDPSFVGDIEVERLPGPQIQELIDAFLSNQCR